MACSTFFPSALSVLPKNKFNYPNLCSLNIIYRYLLFPTSDLSMLAPDPVVDVELGIQPHPDHPQDI